MTADTFTDWSDLAVATAGAAAALTGLLFVAVSINLARIIALPGLPGRAGATLGLLLSLLVVSVFMLAPGQDDKVVGAEIAVVGAVLAVAVALVARKAALAPESRPFRYQFTKALAVIVPAVLIVVGGVVVAVGGPGGPYWILAGMVAGFVGAVLNAWVLLVEIER